MNGEIDLELYTLSIIRLNNAFQKLEDDTVTPDIVEMFEDSAKDFHELYADIINDLNMEDVNFGEYYPFFQNGKQVFPKYIQILKNIHYTELTESLEVLINVFTNLNKIAGEFSNEMIK